MTREQFTDWVDFDPNKHAPKPANGVILEVGPGEITGIPTSSREVLSRLENGVYYIGMDYFRKPLPTYNKFGEYILGDLIGIPLKSNSVDQVWLMNVFGEGDHRYRSPEWDEYSVRDQFLKELVRVLKPGGQIIIGEDNTPAEWLKEVKFKEFGLDEEIFIGARVSEIIEKYKVSPSLSEEFGRPNAWGNPFFIVLTKPLVSIVRRLAPENIQNRHITVELGCGEMPLPLKASEDKFTGKNLYIGLDLPKSLQESVYSGSIFGAPNEGLPHAAERIKRLSPEEQHNIELVAGDILNRQPIRDKSADEVFVSNVLNDPHFGGWGRNWYDFQSLFEEIDRILKPTGRLVIYTSYPPFNGARVKKLLEDNNYAIQSEHSAENQGDLTFIHEYDRIASGPEHLLIAVKSNDSK